MVLQVLFGTFYLSFPVFVFSPPKTPETQEWRLLFLHSLNIYPDLLFKTRLSKET